MSHSAWVKTVRIYCIIFVALTCYFDNVQIFFLFFTNTSVIILVILLSLMIVFFYEKDKANERSVT